MKFNYLLHATTKNALKNWKDQPVPFLDRNYSPHKTPSASRLPRSFLNKRTRGKMTPERKARFDYVTKRVEESRKKAIELERQRMYGTKFSLS